MSIAFFDSVLNNGDPITATDAAPNTTAPEARRIYTALGEQGNAPGTRTIHLHATFVAGTTPSFDGQLWYRDRNSGLWLAIGSAITTLNNTAQSVAGVPDNAEVFFQVTAINGAPTSGIPYLYAA